MADTQYGTWSDGTRYKAQQDDDGRIRFVVMKRGPMVVEQVYMTGEGKDVIVVLGPKT